MTQRARLIANALSFQCVWWALILTQNNGSLVIIGIYLALHFTLIAQAPAREAVLILVGSTLGITVDWVWFGVGVLQANEGYPLWLAAMWPLFLSTLYHSLAWLKHRIFWAGVLGALVAPLSYWGGAALTPISLPNPALSLLALSGFWLIYLPICYQFKLQLDARAR